MSVDILARNDHPDDVSEEVTQNSDEPWFETGTNRFVASTFIVQVDLLLNDLFPDANDANSIF